MAIKPMCATCSRRWYGAIIKTGHGSGFSQWYCMLKKPIVIGDDKALKVKTCKEWAK